MKKIKYLGILLLLLGASSCKDELEEQQKLDDRPVPPAVMEARKYFETYVEEAEMSMEMRGLYPGNFAPDWSKPVITTGDSYICVNVPIVGDVYYEGTFASYYDDEVGASETDYYTAVGQKMIVVKNPTTGNFGCYLLTIIPDEANSTKSSHQASNMFDSGGQNDAFGGTILYTMLGNGDYGVAAERYTHGRCYAAASWWWEPNGDIPQFQEKLTALVGIKKLYAWQKTISKEFCVPVPTPQSSTGTLDPRIGGGSSSSSSGGGSSSISVPYTTSSGAMVNSSGQYQYGGSSGGSGNPNTQIGGGTSGGGTSGGNSSGITEPPMTSSPKPPQVPKNGNTPKDYVPTPGDSEHNFDIFFCGNGYSRNKSVLNITSTIGTDGRGLNMCVPYTMSYICSLFNRKTGNNNRKDPDYFVEYFQSKYVKKNGEPLYYIESKKGGVPTQHKEESVPLFFHVDEKGFSKSFAGVYNALRAGYVVMTAIPRGGTGHCVVIVGVKPNWDIIYYDPAERSLQQVTPASGFMRLDKAFIVIKGNK